ELEQASLDYQLENRLLPVIANGFDRTAFHGFLALRLFVGARRLLENVGITTVVIAGEVGGSGFAAEIAVDALVVHVIFAAGIFRISICNISHKSRGKILRCLCQIASLIWDLDP